MYAGNTRIVLEHTVNPKSFVFRDEEVIGRGYRVVWFLYKGRPYDIGRFYRPDGAWTGYYIDILDPVQWDGDDPHTLRPIVDLFLDIWIAPDGTHVVLDEDEFADAVEFHLITEHQAKSARDTLARLRAGIDSGEFPPPEARGFP